MLSTSNQEWLPLFNSLSHPRSCDFYFNFLMLLKANQRDSMIDCDLKLFKQSFSFSPTIASSSSCTTAVLTLCGMLVYVSICAVYLNTYRSLNSLATRWKPNVFPCIWMTMLLFSRRTRIYVHSNRQPLKHLGNQQFCRKVSWQQSEWGQREWLPDL